MNEELLWQIFLETGNVETYLLLKGNENGAHKLRRCGCPRSKSGGLR